MVILDLSLKSPGSLTIKKCAGVSLVTLYTTFSIMLKKTDTPGYTLRAMMGVTQGCLVFSVSIADKVSSVLGVLSSMSFHVNNVLTSLVKNHNIMSARVFR